MEKQTDIQIICNTQNRLDILKPVFELLHNNKIGKYSKQYYAIDSHIKLSRPASEADILFNGLQSQAHSRGVKINCYSLNIEI